MKEIRSVLKYDLETLLLQANECMKFGPGGGVVPGSVSTPLGLLAMVLGWQDKLSF